MDVSMRLTLKDKSDNNAVYQFVGSSLRVEIFLKKSEHQKKGALKQKIVASLYTFYWGFKRFHLHLTLMFQKIIIEDIRKSCKVYKKTDSWFQKSHKEFGKLKTSSRKSKKLKFDGLLLSKNYIPSDKKLYTEHYFQLYV